jgi:FMN phosphatase YigB (HAD superfamily)
MTYLLDFDRTLFNTDAFIAHLEGRPEAEQFLRERSEAALRAILSAFVRRKEPVFAADELQSFIYPDALEFFRNPEKKAYVLTFGYPDWQREKVERTLGEAVAVSAFYTSNVMKGTYMKDRIAAFHDPVFVDDSPAQLEDMAARCPKVRLYEMRRDGGAGDGRWPVVHSLAGLP